MNETKTYNGWATYETWAVALWLDNEASSSRYWREQAEECWSAARHSRRVKEWRFTRAEAARLELAEKLEEVVHEGSPLQEASLYADLLGAALAEVDWYEIAGHYVADVAGEMVEKLGREKTT